MVRRRVALLTPTIEDSDDALTDGGEDTWSTKVAQKQKELERWEKTLAQTSTEIVQHKASLKSLLEEQPFSGEVREAALKKCSVELTVSHLI